MLDVIKEIGLRISGQKDGAWAENKDGVVYLYAKEGDMLGFVSEPDYLKLLKEVNSEHRGGDGATGGESEDAGRNKAPKGNPRQR